MPNFFTLTRKGEKEPIDLQKLDEEICKALSIPLDPKHWLANWYNYLGQMMAIGKKLGSDELKELARKMDEEACERASRNPDAPFWDIWRTHPSILQSILSYLETNFTDDSWANRR